MSNSIKHIVLFEHTRYESNHLGNSEAREILENHLESVWQNLIEKPNANSFYNQNNEKTEEEEKLDEIDEDEIPDKINSKKNKQRFISFYNKDFKPNNYIGFIQQGDTLIEIYPKIFKTSNENITRESKNKWLNNIFFWLSYCDWLPARLDDTSLDNKDIDSFPEFLIYYIATKFEKVVSEQPFSRYEEVEEVLYSPKGRINFPAYINNGLSRGNWHQVDCVYEPFIYNNSVNQAIKYVTRLLLNFTKFKHSINSLNNIIFILDEVEDKPCTPAQLNQIRLGELFEEYNEILYWCKIILEQQTFNNDAYDNQNFCFLLPMEKIFEGFVGGVLKKEYPDKIQTQKISYLAKTKEENEKDDVFQVKPDIIYKPKNPEMILDTKYKIRKFEKGDKKSGVSQGDMYQMLAYALKFKCKKIKLVYPSNGDDPYETTFKIDDKAEFEIDNKAEITAVNINIVRDSDKSEENIKKEIIKLLDN